MNNILQLYLLLSFFSWLIMFIAKKLLVIFLLPFWDQLFFITSVLLEIGQ